MDSERRTLEQAALEFDRRSLEILRDAADRADMRGEPALAIYFRNQAWRAEHGEWPLS
jgi:hypothetical protein